MIRAIAIDDEPPALQVLKTFCDQSDKIELLSTFTMTSPALEFLQKHQVDLLLLDINMPTISGMDFYKGLDEQMMVIFTTAYSEYAVEGFCLNAIDYLLKPIKPERFLQAVSKAWDFHQYQNRPADDVFYVKSDNALTKVYANQVLFIEAYADYIKIHRKDKKMILTRMTMKSIEALLPRGFVRVHKSFIIKIDQVEQLNMKKAIIENHEIPIGRKYASQIKQFLE